MFEFFGSVCFRANAADDLSRDHRRTRIRRLHQQCFYPQWQRRSHKEVRQDSQVFLLAQVLINLFQRLICHNQKEN